MKIEYRDAHPDDADAIASRLRDRDLAVLRPQGDPAAVIREAINESLRCIVAVADGSIALMWGVRLGSMLDESAYIWMLGTDLVDKYPMNFLRSSRRAVAEMVARYGHLYGECETDFKASARWLRWMGAEFAPSSDERKMSFSIKGAGYGS